MISLSFARSLQCAAVVAEGVVAGFRVSTNTGEPVGLELSDRPRTFCSRVNKYLHSKGWEQVQYMDFRILSYDVPEYDIDGWSIISRAPSDKRLGQAIWHRTVRKN